MNVEQLYALSSYVILALASIVLMIVIAFRMSHRVIQWLSFGFCILAIAAALYYRYLLPLRIDPLFVVDNLSLAFTLLILLAVLVVGMLSYVYFDLKEENPKEYYILLFLATLGSAALAISKHFISFFLSLELLSVSLYSMIAYLRNRNHAIESGIKYLVMASVASAFLLFGLALLYMESGTMDIEQLMNSLGAVESHSLLFYVAICLVGVAAFFKLALVPFHMWVADIYQGAPPPVAAFIATVSKGGLFAFLLRFSQDLHLSSNAMFVQVILVVAVLSMLVGNLLALKQNNIKRLIAYSSVAQFGYILPVLLLNDQIFQKVGIFYLLAYFLAILGAFGALSFLSSSEKEVEELQTFKGMLWQQPAYAFIIALSMLSLIGLPLTAGFISKFYLVNSLVQMHLWVPVAALIIGSVISLYYYLKLVAIMLEQPTTEPFAGRYEFTSFIHQAGLLMLLLTASVSILLGVYPSLLLYWLNYWFT
jgi:NADH-quinone oxidoreductase subunit N